MHFSAAALELLVRDDGLGFDPLPDFAESGHYGLQGMKERAHKLGGKLDIQSRPHRGTSVIATIPRASLILADSDEMLQLQSGLK